MTFFPAREERKAAFCWSENICVCKLPFWLVPHWVWVLTVEQSQKLARWLIMVMVDMSFSLVEELYL